MYRNDRIRLGGGTAIYVRLGLEHSQLDLPSTPSLEATAIIINTNSLGPVKIISSYAQPKTKFTPVDFDAILQQDNLPLIVIGDLNAKHRDWNSRVTNARGKALRDYAINNFLNTIAPVTPTHYHHLGYRPDVLDIAILRGINNHNDLSTLQELSSDHFPILLEVFDEAAEEDEVTLSSTNWVEFSTHHQDNIGPLPSITTIDELEDAVTRLTSSITHSIKHCSKHFSRKRMKCPMLPPQALKLITERRRIRRLWQLNRDPVTKTLYNKLTTQLRDAIRQARNESWNHTLMEAESMQSKIWSLTKALKNRPKGRYTIHSRNGLVYTAQEKADAIAESLADQLSPSFQNMDIPFVESTERFVKNKLQDYDPNPISFTTPTEVFNIIKSTKKKRAPGPDKIPNIALHHLAPKAITALTNIINAIFRLRHFPHSWKLATIITLPKPGKDPKFPQNYRPISLLNSMAKLTETIMLDQILK